MEATEGEGLALGSEAWGDSGGRCAIWEEGQHPPHDWHLLRFPWKCLLRQKKLHCLGKPKLLCQAESLDGEQSQGCQEWQT